MQFTPQQLAGAGRYTAHTRIGNWHEDIQLEETKYKDYNSRKGGGSLLTNFRQQKLNTVNQQVPLSFSADGCLRYGDTIIIEHSMSGGTLANDLWDEVAIGSKQFSATVSGIPSSAPTARNTFVISPEPGGDFRDGDVVEFSAPFALKCNPSLLVDAGTGMLKPSMFLSSCLKSDRQSSKISNAQQVYMAGACKADCLWKMVPTANGRHGGVDRFLAGGSPVTIGADIIIQHIMTAQNLSADPKNTDCSDFGDELEVCCHMQQRTGKSHQLVAEFSGSSIGETAARSERDQNNWKVVTAASPDQAVDTRALPSEMNADSMWVKACQMITGGRGTGELQACFSAMDNGGDGQIDREDFKWGLYDFGIKFDDAQFDMILNNFDKAGNGMISLSEFIAAVGSANSA